jgi:hypothetical protein
MSDPLEQRRITQEDVQSATGTDQAKLFLANWLAHCVGIFDEAGTTVTFHEPTQLGAFATLDLNTGSFAEIGSREARLVTDLDQEAVDLLKTIWMMHMADETDHDQPSHTKRAA